MKFRTKVEIVDAFKWIPGAFFPSPEFDNLHAKASIQGSLEDPSTHYLAIESGGPGVVKAFPHDWVIRDVDGDFFPCKPDVFEKYYEVVR